MNKDPAFSSLSESDKSRLWLCCLEIHLLPDVYQFKLKIESLTSDLPLLPPLFLWGGASLVAQMVKNLPDMWEITYFFRNFINRNVFLLPPLASLLKRF